MVNATKPYYVIIPAYNEAPRVKKVIERVKKYSTNILVVDDGSPDKTSQIAKSTGVIVLRHKINLGKGSAMKTGAEAAFKLGAQAVIFLDADGQHKPESLPKFIKALKQGYPVVFGSRNLSYGVPLVRYLGNKIGALIINFFFGIYRNDMLCGFFALTKEAYFKIIWDSTRYGVETEIVARTGKNRLKFTEVAIDTIYLDKYKGVSILDAIGIFFNIPHWLLD